MRLLFRHLTIFQQLLKEIPDEKLLINTINAYSFNKAQKDQLFSEAILKSDILLPDGISIVYACKILNGIKIRKIAGYDLFKYEMDRLERIEGTCFFLGSTVETLQKIIEKASKEYPKVKVHTYSPTFTNEFSDNESSKIIEQINAIKPHVLFIGLAAPKQEKWAYKNYRDIDSGHICSIGAVFDFYAGTISRAPQWMIKIGLEWLYRLIREPFRLWKRYLIGNAVFIFYIFREYFSALKRNV